MGQNADGSFKGARGASGADIGNWHSNAASNYGNRMAGMQSPGRQRGGGNQASYNSTGMTPGMANLPPETLSNQQQGVQARNQEMFRTQSGQGQNLQPESMPQTQSYQTPSIGHRPEHQNAAGETVAARDITGRSAYNPATRTPSTGRANPNPWQGAGQQGAMANALRGGRGRQGGNEGLQANPTGQGGPQGGSGFDINALMQNPQVQSFFSGLLRGRG